MYNFETNKGIFQVEQMNTYIKVSKLKYDIFIIGNFSVTKEMVSIEYRLPLGMSMSKIISLFE